MLPALPSLIAPSADVPVRSTPPLLEKRRYHGVSAQKLEDLAAICLGAPRIWGLMLGLAPGVDSLKTLLPAFLSSVPPATLGLLAR